MIIGAASLLAFVASAQAYGYIASNPDGPFPAKTESGQYGINNCSVDSKSANCQTLRLNSIDDFCLWAPHSKGTVGDSEASVVSYCLKAGHGSRLMPQGTLTGVHWVNTDRYLQITGTGDFTKLNIPKGDQGGELDPHGADGNGNPKGGLVITNHRGKNEQILEWTQFISYNQFCIRACYHKDGDKSWCNHIYDVMGCEWNMPANYAKGSYDTCDAATPAYPMGVYKKGSSLSTFHQGVGATPTAQAKPKSSNCKATKLAYANYGMATSVNKSASASKSKSLSKSSSKAKATTTTVKPTTKKTSTSSKKTTTKTTTTTKKSSSSSKTTTTVKPTTTTTTTSAQSTVTSV